MKLLAFYRLCLIAWLSCSVSVHAEDKLPTVDRVALERYSGLWYEVARLPNRFERECVGDITATYALLPTGMVDVLNQCRKLDGALMSARGLARSADGRSTSQLEVRFAPAWLGVFPFVWGDYWVIDLAADYSWSMVGSSDRKYFWILSRQPAMDKTQIDRLLKKAQAIGFDTKQVVFVKNMARETMPVPRAN
ncbi:MAG: lipocalin family protein [Methylophilaceae bacterium]|nr:lipocalin family protein [Methylophilaceae bacterium]